MCFAFFCKTVDLIRKYFPVVKKTGKKTLDIKSDVLHLGIPGYARSGNKKNATGGSNYVDKTNSNRNVMRL
jgi:hypothetical protein